MASIKVILFWIIIACMGAALPVNSATSSGPLIDQGERCRSLEVMDFSDDTDTTIHIERAVLIKAQGNISSHCWVEGRITPRLEFEILLPIATWNGGLLTIAKDHNEACNPYLKRGYACLPIYSFGARTAPSPLTIESVRATMDDFLLRGHWFATSAKAIIEKYYSTPPRRAYLMGCSGGGYEALISAQAFPWDYQGIIVGDTNLDTVDWSMRTLWSIRNLRHADGRPILDDSDLQTLHRAVLTQCDRDDGVEDGVVGHAMACRFDPSPLHCQHGKSERCLSSAKLEAVKRIYAGPTTSSGERIASPGVLPGSELLWSSIPAIADYAALYLKYSFSGAQANIDASHFDFDRDYRRPGQGVRDTYNNPDLRKFKAAGGKLILYQGTNDVAHGVTGAIDYYETVERVMGGRSATQEFARLFVVPGANHCTGGDGAYAIDYLSHLEAWVDKGRAPDVMIGAHLTHAQYPIEFPLDPALPVSFTRPVYPYPLYAKYTGSGDSNDAANFIPIDPSSSERPSERRSPSSTR